MTDLYLVRHGETEWSADGRHTSVTDLELTDNGVRQAESLRGHLDPASFGLILASPRRRARRTAELAGFAGDHEPQMTEDLVEWFYGDYEGITSATIHQTRSRLDHLHPPDSRRRDARSGDRAAGPGDLARSGPPAWSGRSASATATPSGPSPSAGWAWI